MDLLLLKGFNNYFNRIVKKYSTLADYKTNSTSFLEFSNINFNPNDGVVAELILGSTTQQEAGAPLAWDQLGTPDYLICSETANNTTTIKFRWFILESERTRDGQYRLALKRDVIVDNLNAVINAPCFVQKGMLDVSNPLIFNKEAMTYNQIKKSELLLKDKSKSAWIVGYLATNSSADGSYTTSITLNSSGQGSGTYTHTGPEGPISNIVDAYVEWNGHIYRSPAITTTINSSGDINYSISLPGLYNDTVNVVIDYQCAINISMTTNDDIEYSEYIDSASLPWNFSPSDTSVGMADYMQCDVGFVDAANASNNEYKYYYSYAKLRVQQDGSFKANTSEIETPYYLTPVSVDITGNFNNYIPNGGFSWLTFGNSNKYKTAVNSKYVFSSSEATQIFTSLGLNLTATASPAQYNNKIIKHNGLYYRLTVGAMNSGHQLYTTTAGSTMNTAIQGKLQEVSTAYNTSMSINVFSYHSVSQPISIDIYYNTYPVTIEQLTSTETISATIPSAGNRTHLIDAPFDMFCIPYNEVNFYNNSLVSSPYYSLQFALNMAKDLGASRLYDLQLLPYCPAQALISADNTINERAGTEGKDYVYIKKSNNDKVSFILFCTKSTGTLDLDYQVNIENYTNNASINTKVSNECDLYRLISPNYSGQFEFSVAKNGGSVSNFNVDYTYRPYTPYLHVNPNFSGLYGQDFDDSRGLILGGDFSLPVVTSA